MSMQFRTCGTCRRQLHGNNARQCHTLQITHELVEHLARQDQIACLLSKLSEPYCMCLVKQEEAYESPSTAALLEQQDSGDAMAVVVKEESDDQLAGMFYTVSLALPMPHILLLSRGSHGKWLLPKTSLCIFGCTLCF